MSMDINITIAVNYNCPEYVARACQKLLSQQLSVKYPSATVMVATSYRTVDDEVHVKNCTFDWENTLIEREIAINDLQQVWDICESIVETDRKLVA